MKMEKMMMSMVIVMGVVGLIGCGKPTSANSVETGNFHSEKQTEKSELTEQAKPSEIEPTSSMKTAGIQMAIPSPNELVEQKLLPSFRKNLINQAKTWSEKGNRELMNTKVDEGDLQPVDSQILLSNCPKNQKSHDTHCINS